MKKFFILIIVLFSSNVLAHMEHYNKYNKIEMDIFRNGEFKYPINEITIAGNFKDMFQNITLANDLEFEYSTNSPTMMIEGMVVAGK